MTEARWHSYASATQLAQAVADQLAAFISDALRNKVRALLALPGGQTPVPIYKLLSQARIDWAQVTILPTDERLVAGDSPLSNARLLQQHFQTVGADVIPLVSEPGDLTAVAGAAAHRLHALDWPPDLIWLGMGGDGHTASLFAGPDLDQAMTALQRVVGVRPDPLPPEAPVARLSLSGPAIASAPHLLIVITGDAKRQLLTHAIAAGRVSPLPIGRLLAQTEAQVEIHWSPA